MKSSKNYYSKDRIRIFHSNIVERILVVWYSVAFPSMGIFVISMGAYDNEQERDKMLATLCGIVLLAVWMLFSTFGTYILLDLRKGKLTVKEFPGFTKKEFDIHDIRKIVILDGVYAKEVFTINIVGPIYTHQIYSWTFGRAGRSLTETLSMKRQRLEGLALKCNHLIKEYNEYRNKQRTSV